MSRAKIVVHTQAQQAGRAALETHRRKGLKARRVAAGKDMDENEGYETRKLAWTQPYSTAKVTLAQPTLSPETAALIRKIQEE